MSVLNFINLLNLLLFFLWFFLFIKALLKILYIIQLKEYRLDRMKAFLKTYSGKRFFLPTRHILRPKLTAKIILIFLSTFLMSFFISFFLYFNLLDCKAFLAGLLLSYILIPLLIVASLGLFYPLETLVKRIIVLLAKRKISLFKNLLKIGITGSFGKTGTKEILTSVLQVKYKICKTRGTDNTILGIAKTILKDLKENHQIFVVEMGAYKIGEISQICRLVNPKIGIITGVNEQHLELFGSLENTARAKFELVEALPKDGLAVLNSSNKYTLEMVEKAKCKVAFFGKRKTKYKTSLVGDHYQENIRAALVVADYLRVPQQKALKQIKKIKPFAQAIKIKKVKKGTTIIDDSYNSNPGGFLSALKLITGFKKKRKIIITPGIIELGKTSEKIHQNLGKQIAEVANWLILTDKNFYKPIFKGIKKAKKRIKVDVLNKSILEKLKKIKSNTDTLILLEGRVPLFVKKVLQI